MIVTVLLLLGLCFGSFTGALVWRLYQQGLPKKKRVASDDELSITKGRSMCPHCQHTLGVRDLIPLISWLALRGKCRYCRAPIGVQELLLEIAMPLLFIATYLFWPLELAGQGLFELIIWLVALVALVALFVYDLRWMLLPTVVMYALIGLGVIRVLGLAVFFDGGLQAVLDGLYGLLIAGGIFYALNRYSPRLIGAGDATLGFGLGLLLGSAPLAFMLLFVASTLGTIVAAPGLLTKKLGMASKLPFGPFLIVAALIVKLFGATFLDWYSRQLGLY